MTSYAGMSAGKINGLTAHSVSFDYSREMHDVTMHHGTTRHRVLGVDSCSARFDIYAEHGDDIGNISDIIGKSLMSLGKGKACPYCDTYWPSGNYICYNCGGKLEEYPFIKPMVSDMVVTQVNHCFSGSNIITIGITAEGSGFGSALSPHFSECSFHSISYNSSLKLGHYLCEWCGHAVKNGKTCYGCGGPRTPLRELVDMDHECLWCGNKTINGIVCEACGTRVQGKTIGEVLDEEG